MIITQNGKMESTRIGRYYKFVVQFHNRMCDNAVSSVEQIPPQRLEFMLKMSYKSLIAPFLMEKIMAGNSNRQIATQFNVSRGYVQRTRQTLRQSDTETGQQS